MLNRGIKISFLVAGPQVVSCRSCLFASSLSIFKLFVYRFPGGGVFRAIISTCSGSV